MEDFFKQDFRSLDVPLQLKVFGGLGAVLFLYVLVTIITG